MPVAVRLTRSRDAAGRHVVRLGVLLLDEYLEFLAGRCRPNTVLAVAYDLKVFFTVVGKPPRRVRTVDVLAFMTAQRTGGQARLHVAGEDAAGGVSARTLRRRLSSVSGLYGFLHARGDVTVNPVPRGLPTRRERQRPGQGVPLARVARTLPRILDPAKVDALTGAADAPGPGDGRGDGAGRAAPLARSWACGWRTCGWPSGGCLSPRARAGTSGWSRSRRGCSPRSAPTWMPSASRGSLPTGCSSCSRPRAAACRCPPTG